MDQQNTNQPKNLVLNGIESKAAEQSSISVQNKINIDTLPVRAYLDETVVPILLQGLATLVKDRPENPIEYLAAYLLKNNPQKSNESKLNTQNTNSQSLSIEKKEEEIKK